MKTKKIVFQFKGKKHQFSFVPTDSDEWMAFTSKKNTFDVHYCEDYKSINVYEVINNKADYKKSIANFTL